MQSRSLSFTGSLQDLSVESRVFKASAYSLAGMQPPEDKIDSAENPGRSGVTRALLRVVPGFLANTLPIFQLETFSGHFVPPFEGGPIQFACEREFPFP